MARFRRVRQIADLTERFITAAIRRWATDRMHRVRRRTQELIRAMRIHGRLIGNLLNGWSALALALTSAAAMWLQQKFC